MIELSLHIADIVENSTRAGAEVVAVSIEEDSAEDRLTISILDNGRGMDEATVQAALDPFMTTKANKKTGLGLSLLREAARKAGGDLTINSVPGQGTAVEAVFSLNHVDRQPLGDLALTFKMLLVSHPETEFQFEYAIDGRIFEWDSSAIYEAFGDRLRTDPEVLKFIRTQLSSIDTL